MPYKSDVQRAYFNANRAELERQGVNVDEWNAASEGQKLPKRISKPKAMAKRNAAGYVPLTDLGM
jgi:hypothetical protein